MKPRIGAKANRLRKNTSSPVGKVSDTPLITPSMPVKTTTARLMRTMPKIGRSWRSTGAAAFRADLTETGAFKGNRTRVARQQTGLHAGKARILVRRRCHGHPARLHASHAPARSSLQPFSGAGVDRAHPVRPNHGGKECPAIPSGWSA